jgi:predicted Zn finger-like uncharacterized protein
MIVICTKCEAKFRIADDRVGARGANVRCSRCKNVFLVQPPAPAAAAHVPAALAVDLEPSVGSTEAPAAPRFDPFAEGPVRAAVGARPPPIPPPLPGSAPPPPSAAGPLDALASGGVPDPFAAFPSAPAFDPFAVQPDPFAPAAEIPEADPAGLLALAAGGAAFTGAPGQRTPEVTTAGLALEDRHTPHPMPAARLGGVGADPLGPGDGFDQAAYDPGGFGDEEPLALASEPAFERAEPLAFDAPGEAASAPLAESPPRRPAVAAPPEPDARIPGARGSGLRAAVVNAIALAALLGAALAILVVWRAEGPLDAASLRPAALLAALRGAGAAGAFSARDVRSGLYERERGPPLLFVRGEVVSRAPAPVARVKVAVEVVRGGRVIARGSALAGAVPSPEALHRADDAAALAAAARAATSGAPARVAPGDVVPFLVAIADHPADLAGASLRIEVAPADEAP